MSERPRLIDLTTPDERAFLIGLDSGRTAQWPVARSLAELGALAETAGATVVGSASQQRSAPDPVWYFGKGRAQELVDHKAVTDFNVLIVDDELAPNQQRSLETLLDCKVLDRSALIIDIFARHAKTREGRLQVELAALAYHLPRLTRMWTHLSRTAGGIGTRGPGESQLETDRRLIREKIRKVRAELDDVKRHRTTSARLRDRAEVASIALVGYTNAGKSTLLNAISNADLYAADMLFATLDPTSRGVALPTGQRVVISDTVGFINKLPHDLVEAFRATLEEVLRADLLLEVVDAANPDFEGQQRAVGEVLDELGAGETPRIVVFNKIDLIDADLRTSMTRVPGQAIFVSATTGEGLPQLLAAIADALRRNMVPVDLLLPYARGDMLARAKAAGEVTEEFGGDGVRVAGHLPPTIAAELASIASGNGPAASKSGAKVRRPKLRDGAG